MHKKQDRYWETAIGTGISRPAIPSNKLAVIAAADRRSTQRATRSVFHGSWDDWDSRCNFAPQEQSRWGEPRRDFLQPRPRHLRDLGLRPWEAQNSIRPADVRWAIPPAEPRQMKRCRCGIRHPRRRYRGARGRSCCAEGEQLTDDSCRCRCLPHRGEGNQGRRHLASVLC